MSEDDNNKINFLQDDVIKVFLDPTLDSNEVAFYCKRAMVKPNEVLTEWPNGFPLNFSEIHKLVFIDGKKQVTYSKIREERVE